MTQYRLDKVTDTWLKYDEKADVWRPTAEGTTALQKAPERTWEAMGDNPIVELTRQSLQPYESAQDAISVSQQGKQQDDAITIARGTLIRSLPVIALSLPLSAGIAALAWLSGIVTAGFVAYVVSVLVLWGGFSLFLYSRIAANDHKHSHYGTEHHKIDALTGIKHRELDMRERVVMRVLDMQEKRLGVNRESD